MRPRFSVLSPCQIITIFPSYCAQINAAPLFEVKVRGFSLHHFCLSPVRGFTVFRKRMCVMCLQWGLFFGPKNMGRDDSKRVFFSQNMGKKDRKHVFWASKKHGPKGPQNACFLLKIWAKRTKNTCFGPHKNMGQKDPNTRIFGSKVCVCDGFSLCHHSQRARRPRFWFWSKHLFFPHYAQICSMHLIVAPTNPGPHMHPQYAQASTNVRETPH